MNDQMNNKTKTKPLPASNDRPDPTSLTDKSGDFKADDGASKPADAVERDPLADLYEGSLPGKPQKMRPGLYPVATPIGNLRDITLRALDVLKRADVICCEDSRITKRLLSAYGINGPLLVYHEHNAASVRPKILEHLERGEIVALVTDAGTPLVSDPGFKLVREVTELGHKVYPIPGACAPIAAIAGAGLPSDRFLFAGFPPNKKQARRSFLEEFSPINATLIFFESPKRLKDCLAEMADLWPAREAVVARELTKLYEEFQGASLPELAERFRDSGPVKGEIVILVEPPAVGEQSQALDLDELLMEALQDMSVRDATSHVMALTGLKKKQVYQRALELKDQQD